MKFLQQAGMALLVITAACNEPLKNNQQMEDDNAAVQPKAEEIAAASQKDKEEGGLKASKPVIKGDYKLAVRVQGDGSARSLVFAAADMRGDTTKADSTTLHDIKGRLLAVTVEDLDKDGNPEVYCFTRSDGQEAEGSVYGMTYINHKPSRIFSGDVELDSLPDYRGRDTFFVQQNMIIRKYPAYKANDPEGVPSGGEKTLKYTLKKEPQRYVLKQQGK